MITIVNEHGFFLIFFKVLSWRLCNINKRKIVIDFTQSSDVNIWYEMFEPYNDYIENDTNNSIKRNFPNSNYPYPLHIYIYIYIYIWGFSSTYSNELFNEINTLKWTSFLSEYVKKKQTVLKNPQKTIAVFIRFPGHFKLENNFTISDYIDNIIKELDSVMIQHNYEHIFLVTMVELFYQKIVDS